MRKLFYLFVCVWSFNTYSQKQSEQVVKSKVNAVTVFLESAQITRNKSITLEKGITVLKFVNLSPFIDGKSIQIHSKNVEIQSVNFQKNFLKKNKKNAEIIELEKRLALIDSDIELEKTYRNIVFEELKFLQSNRNIGGKNETLSAANLKEAATFYGTKLRSLKLKEIEINKKLNSLKNLASDLDKQIANFSSKKEFASGEIFVKVNAKSAQKNTIKLVYNVSNAGWFPSYDVRTKNINSPLNLVYKANVKQNTKVDWNNVKIRFSSADPTVSSSAPELKTYYLNYGSLPPSYQKSTSTISENLSDFTGNISTITGRVLDISGPLPGVSILVKGTTIGTETDFDGNYSISIPKDANALTYSYLGYKTVEQSINASIINIRMTEDAHLLEEVVVTALGINREKQSFGFSQQNAFMGRRSSGTYSSKKKKKKKPNYSIPTQQIINQTTVDFEIVAPYSLKSNNKSYAVGMKTYELPASYKYISIPKIDTNAFLIANITNWEQYNLLEGEANIYFEDTYIGKSLLDVRFAKDILQISLGRDKNVVIQRDKIKDYTTKQFIGSKKQENRAWDIIVKNNKKQAIDIVISDQVPVSELDEIKIMLDKNYNGVYNKETGELKWEFKLEPNKVKNLQLKYAVKFPKYKNLVLD